MTCNSSPLSSRWVTKLSGTFRFVQKLSLSLRIASADPFTRIDTLVPCPANNVQEPLRTQGSVETSATLAWQQEGLKLRTIFLEYLSSYKVARGYFMISLFWFISRVNWLLKSVTYTECAWELCAQRNHVFRRSHIGSSCVVMLSVRCYSDVRITAQMRSWDVYVSIVCSSRWFMRTWETQRYAVNDSSSWLCFAFGS